MHDDKLMTLAKAYAPNLILDLEGNEDFEGISTQKAQVDIYNAVQEANQIEEVVVMIAGKSVHLDSLTIPSELTDVDQEALVGLMESAYHHFVSFGAAMNQS
ncbi:hypothetical protein [Neptuniibacter sp. QD37_11]|uniref:hypothetical protein n=1 Tax=Neptuniibacter sp. QD37_11 TaxID=3398209 RepID=UPI0039F5F48D